MNISPGTRTTVDISAETLGCGVPVTVADVNVNLFRGFDVTAVDVPAETVGCGVAVFVADGNVNLSRDFDVLGMEFVGVCNSGYREPKAFYHFSSLLCVAGSVWVLLSAASFSNL